MITIVDYGIGNLHSVRKAVEFVGGEAIVTGDPALFQKADKVILPGVGAFKDGMRGLASSGFIPAIESFVASGRPLLGICLGMQLLFEQSREAGRHTGLGILPGQVRALEPDGLKVPQIGWNQLVVQKESPLFTQVGSGSYVYFNHSFYCQPTDPGNILATTDYGASFAAVVGSGQVFGFQFHPEKSQRVGLQLLQNFVAL
jgi:glutamine amidotransferase